MSTASVNRLLKSVHADSKRLRALARKYPKQKSYFTNQIKNNNSFIKKVCKDKNLACIEKDLALEVLM